MTRTLVTICIAVLLVLPASALAGTGQLDYGAACQEKFEEVAGEQWLDEITGANKSCSDFLYQLSRISGSVQQFFWNLEGVGPALLEESNDNTFKVEKSDITLVMTHMGAWTGLGADIAGWKAPSPNYLSTCQNGGSSCAVSDRMKLGNESEGLSILAMAGCTTLSPTAAQAGQPDPLLPGEIREYGAAEDIWPRWDQTFKAGLRFATGTWDVQKISGANQIGNKFGSYLRGGQTIAEAWRRAQLESHSDNDPAVLATGTSSSNCTSRLYNMTIYNFNVGTTNERLSGSQIKKYCWHRWW